MSAMEYTRARRAARKNGWRYNHKTRLWYKNVLRDGRTQIIRIKSVLEIHQWEADEAASFRARAEADKVEKMIATIYAQREEILTAFVAKHGFQPEEAEQVEERRDDGTTVWYIRKREAR